jgi:hypothetical protein
MARSPVLKVCRKVASFVALAALSASLFAGAASAQGLVSDQADYPPGDIAVLVGVGFTPGENVTMQVLHADGTPSDGDDHAPWTAVANGSGYVLTYWHVCEDDCVGSLLRATAVGWSSGVQSSTTFTDATRCDGGTGIATVTSDAGSCVAGTPPSGSGPYNFEVVEGGMYTLTLTGVTECTGGAITVFLQNGNTGDVCFNAIGGGGTYVGSFTMPNPACNTYSISYKCGADAPCNSTSTFAARGPLGACSSQLRASTFDGNCANPTPDTNCLGACVCDDAPILTDCPGGCSKDDLPGCNFFHDLGCNPTSVPDFDASITASDSCGPVTVHGAATNATVGCTHLRRIDYRATNDCGTTTCVAAYVWTEDVTGPTITCPDDVNVDCAASTDPSHTGSASATDGCGTASTPTFSDSIAAGHCPGAFVITRTWSSTDTCGNSSSCVQMIHVSDTHAPLITCPADVMVDCSAPTDPGHTGSATATDDCSGVASITHADAVANGNCAGSRVISRTWTATDNCGNSSSCVQTISVSDMTPPTIHCPAAVTANGSGACCVSMNLGTATASDDCSGVTITNDAPSQFCVGNTTVTWTATDGCGNSSTCTQGVKVLGQICATKFYDANANGVQDDGEVGVAGWLITVSGAASFSGTTDSHGRVCFDVPVGAYTVSEASASETNWVHTTATSCPVTIDSTHCSSSCSFGNYCFKAPSNGFTLGWWTNMNGQSMLAAVDPAWRTVINDLNLVNASGQPFSVPTTGSFSAAYALFKPWLKGATATNMAYMLSAQLAATSLDVNYAGLSDTTGVVVPGGVKTGGNVCIVPYLSSAQAITCGTSPLLALTSTAGSASCGCASNDAVVTVADLRARANCLLAAYPIASSAGTPRTYEECVKDILDMINNNGNNGYSCGGVSQYINSGSSTCPATFH